jgi:hypothetical protein
MCVFCAYFRYLLDFLEFDVLIFFVPEFDVFFWAIIIIVVIVVMPKTATRPLRGPRSRLRLINLIYESPL